jgi:calcineurin-like phosphoesterase family protein
MDKNIWFTSDSHYFHTNIAGPKVSQWKSGYRDFENEKEMSDCIVNTINKYVKSNDILYHLGDWSFKNLENVGNFRKRLVVQTIHLCYGNHDLSIKSNKFINKYQETTQQQFTSVQDVIWDKIGGYEIFLSHYSQQVWPGSHKNVYHLFGHSHGNLEGIGRSMDVGIDVAYKLFGEYRPFSLEEVIDILNKKQIQYIDHHDKTTNVR